jgi:hypothetical protein
MARSLVSEHKPRSPRLRRPQRHLELSESAAADVRPTKTMSKPRTVSRADRLSLSGPILVLVLTNVWFFSEVLAYVH